MLPDIDGSEVVRRLRAARIETPVLILSGVSRPQTKVKVFGMGADDFITKPFDQQELVARLQAIVRRAKGFSQPTLSVGPLNLNLGSREVTVEGRTVHLTGKEYAILELLALRKGMVMTKEAFLNHLYGGIDEPEVKIIDVFICKLRKKLAQAGATDLIGTVWGRGYVLRDPAAGRGAGWQPATAVGPGVPVAAHGHARGLTAAPGGGVRLPGRRQMKVSSRRGVSTRISWISASLKPRRRISGSTVRWIWA